MSMFTSFLKKQKLAVVSFINDIKVFEVVRDMEIAEFISDNRQALVITVLLIILWLVVLKRPRDIPPGPSFSLPVLGDILRIGRDPLERFRDMRRRYGDVFSFYMGNRLVVVLNGFDVIKSALVTHADVFRDRPHMFMMDEICEGKGIVASSGRVWKEQRQFAQTTMRMLSSGAHTLETSIQEEASQLIDAFDQQTATFDPQTTTSDPQTATFDPRALIEGAVSNVMCTLCFGRRFRYDNLEFVAYLDAVAESFKSFHATQILNIFPCLKYLPGDRFLYKQMMRHKHFVEHDFLEHNIAEISAAADDRLDATNFTEAYLRSMRQARSEGRSSSMDELNLKQSLGNIFTGGTESMTGTLCWALLYFMEYPEIQERCFQEIREQVGLDRRPTMKDKISCPFLAATIMEILRHADVSPLAVAHSVSEDFVFMGYRIPKDSIVLPNIDSVMRDEDIWGDPVKFRPERFLDGSGKVLKPEKYIPFSMGRRICLGETIAKMELFHFLSSLLQRFRFERPSDGDLCFEGVLGLTWAPKPFKVKVVRRM
ncbi:vitamin D(3) 25-hydroxylase-like [Gigantopelta aegis]|uniref:vitamin D(3) 25-hydroxylase-like n=1 Tax=Gigantopelta aegis TaxID=1735272 RepID=UPI001B88B749|nr:vitamin D(3) 25-hydroxylase-like [Gigantopelta aegis]